MTEPELLEKLTGVNNPRFITPREDAIIKECLTIINELEQQLLIHSVVNCLHEDNFPINRHGDSQCTDCGKIISHLDM